MKNKQQKGAALLTAVLITAVVAILASNIILNQHEWIAQTGLADRQNNFQLVANRIQDWGYTASTMRSHLKDPSQLPAWPAFKKNMQGVQVVSSLTDGNTLYNINWLIYPSMDDSFARLIHSVDQQVSLVDAFKLAVTLTSALQMNGDTKPSRTQIVPAPQKIDNIPVVGPVLSLLQFRAIHLIDPTVIAKIAPYISVLPADAGINMTTGNKVVMHALLKPTQDEDTIWNAYLSCRLSFKGRHPNAGAWHSCLTQNDGQKFLDNFGVSSENFSKDGGHLSGNQYQRETEERIAQTSNKPSFQLLIYRSNYAVLTAVLNQTDLTSYIRGIYWLPNQLRPPIPNSPYNTINRIPKVTLVSYQRS